eukprot:Pgem_evm1s10296
MKTAFASLYLKKQEEKLMSSSALSVFKTLGLWDKLLNDIAEVEADFLNLEEIVFPKQSQSLIKTSTRKSARLCLNYDSTVKKDEPEQDQVVFLNSSLSSDNESKNSNTGLLAIEKRSSATSFATKTKNGAIEDTEAINSPNLIERKKKKKLRKRSPNSPIHRSLRPTLTPTKPKRI